MLVGAGILETAAVTATSFDADGILDFAGEAIKEYLQARPEGEQTGKEENVLELDYTAHVSCNAEVKAMFLHHTQTPRARSPTQTESAPQYSTQHNHNEI